MPASGSRQTLRLTLSPWVDIQWDLNAIQHINSCCTLFVARHLALTAAFSHLELCDNRLSSTEKPSVPLHSIALRQDGDLAAIRRDALPQAAVRAPHRDPRNHIVCTGTPVVCGNLDVGKRREPSFNVVSQCDWTACSTVNQLWSGSHLMSHAALVNDLVEHAKSRRFHTSLKNLSTMSTGCMSCRVGMGLTRKR